ncbi:MAG: hypothetical protein V4450_08815 [Bacteroidota bacterium]
MANEKQITEKESLEIITNMIKKAKGSYYDTGIGSLLWGSVVAIASFTTYLEREYDFWIGFDIWLIVLAAIVPQIIISVREKRTQVVLKYEDDALNAVWLVYGISIFGMIAYQNIIPGATIKLNATEGWQMMKHYTDNRVPDQELRPFAPSVYSLFILLYAFPTLVTGIVKKFKPMLLGSFIAYASFIISCFTAAKYDMLLGGVTAIFCWFIPGIILRRKYLAQKKATANV